MGLFTVTNALADKLCALKQAIGASKALPFSNHFVASKISTRMSNKTNNVTSHWGTDRGGKGSQANCGGKPLREGLKITRLKVNN